MTITDTAIAIPAQRTEAAETGTWAIVQRAQAGDTDAFGELWQLYHAKVYRFILFKVGGSQPQLAQDLTGDTFVRAQKAIRQWAPMGREYGAFLMTVARNLVADYFKSGRYRLEITTGDVLDSDRPDPGPDPAATIAGRSCDRVVRAAVMQLNPEQREVIRLRFYEDQSVAETAAAMGKEVGAIKALQYRAVRTLGRLLPDLEALR